MTFAGWPFYLVTVAGAVAVYCLVPRADRTAARGRAALGVLLGAAAAAGLIVWLVSRAPIGAWKSLAQPTVGPLFYVFAVIALATAIRVIVHPRPVYSALYFVMTVLAVAGMVLLAGGQFLAVAIIIIYAGAILVTYVFVIMLAQQAHSDDLAGSASYDVRSRPPFVPLLVGFLLLAAIVGPMSEPGMYPEPRAEARGQAAVDQTVGLQRDRELPLAARNDAENAESGEDNQVAGDSVAALGAELYRKHMLAVELAGVLLLVAIVGAVAIARKRITADDVIQLKERKEPANG